MCAPCKIKRKMKNNSASLSLSLSHLHSVQKHRSRKPDRCWQTRGQRNAQTAMYKLPQFIRHTKQQYTYILSPENNDQ